MVPVTLKTVCFLGANRTWYTAGDAPLLSNNVYTSADDLGQIWTALDPADGPQMTSIVKIVQNPTNVGF